MDLENFPTITDEPCAQCPPLAPVPTIPPASPADVDAVELEQPTDTLAFTGTDPGPLAALGVALVLVGAALTRRSAR